MTQHSEQERLLVHDTVATTVDTIVAAIDEEIARVDPQTDGEGLTRAASARRDGVLEGLRMAKGAAAVASVTARAAALNRPDSQAGS